ncbi:MAG: methyltransferase domain-containing protein [Gammaproteobacteria bacterium]|nr:methyltransferase domain-containing protein [Gammaproteobacteria bacterium]
MRFDAEFYRQYYVDPRTRVASREDTERLGLFVCAYARYLGIQPRSVLDAGCGLGHMRRPVRRVFPKASYVGLETSDYLCRRHGWIQGTLESFRPRGSFELVICHDVLQYLDDRAAARAIGSLARLCAGALYFSVLTTEDWRQAADQSRTDSGVHLRDADWYRRRLGRHFRPVGGGLLVRRGFRPLLWELEKPWPAPASRRLTQA